MAGLLGVLHTPAPAAPVCLVVRDVGAALQALPGSVWFWNLFRSLPLVHPSFCEGPW